MKLFVPRPKPFGEMRIARAKDKGLLLIFPAARNEEFASLDPGNWKGVERIGMANSQVRPPYSQTRGSSRVFLKGGILTSLFGRRSGGKLAPVVSRRSLLIPESEVEVQSLGGRRATFSGTIEEYPEWAPDKVLNRATVLQARVKLWLLAKGFHTDEPLAVHVSPSGERTLITRFIATAYKADTLSSEARGLLVERLKAAGVLPHDYAGGGNLVKGKDGKNYVLDSELFQVNEKWFRNELDALLERARKVGRLRS